MGDQDHKNEEIEQLQKQLHEINRRLKTLIETSKIHRDNQRDRIRKNRRRISDAEEDISTLETTMVELENFIESRWLALAVIVTAAVVVAQVLLAVLNVI